jgi:transposase-like protein
MEDKKSNSRNTIPEKHKINKHGNYHRSFRLVLFKELSTGEESIEEIAKKYGVKSSTLSAWKSIFKEEYEHYKLLSTMKEKKQLNKHELLAENERLQKALEHALLKNRALETLIDVAEEELNIKVRKKSGPKQSKG